MTPNRIALIRSTFAPLAADPDGVAQAFYARLFTIAPQLRALFPLEMAGQRGKLMTMLGAPIGLLENPALLVQALQALGRRHVVYHVRDEHYELVGAALLDALATGLGDAFTPEVRAAWTEFYGVAAYTMKLGAAQVAAA